MSRVAVDTNVLVHLYDDAGSGKLRRAEEVVAGRPTISPQVVSEYLNVTRRLLALPKAQVLARCNQVFSSCEIAPVTHGTLGLAARLLARYDF